MTNYPPMQPPPPGQPPYGQQQQQYGQPPYGQPPGGAAYGMPAQPQPGNGWGVAALVTGLVGMCLPFVGGLLAIVFGIVGIKRSGKTHTGKGMSIAGLILGLLSLAVWGVFGGALLALFKGTEVNRNIARQFITDLHAQNTTAAASAVDPAQVTDDELKTLATAISGGGAIQDITNIGVNANADAGAGTTVQVVSVVTFAGGKQAKYAVRQVKVGDQWKIVDVELVP